VEQGVVPNHAARSELEAKFDRGNSWSQSKVTEKSSAFGT
jgi:hypothetical protein